MRDVYVFVGPTLRVEQASRELDAVYLPPVAEGDVYRLWRMRPRAIGIVDGYFERIPAVWHKEILFMMANGVHVFGGASMGALRAAELHTFGMHGVGWVFERFKDGTLDQDDEVAVSHGTDEQEYRSFSLAMVSIRRSLHNSTTSETISPVTQDKLLAAAKSLFYGDRTWPAIFRDAEAAGADVGELDALRGWLSDGYVDQKAQDALAMLGQMRDFLLDDPPPMQVSWTMANTVMWNDARRRAGAIRVQGADLALTHISAVLDEVRLLGPSSFEDARRRSLLRRFATADAEQAGRSLDGGMLRDAVHRFRLRHGLVKGTDLGHFLAENDLTIGELESLVETEEKARWANGWAEQEAFGGFLDDLRLRGEYQRFVGRARSKDTELRQRGLFDAEPRDVGCEEEEVLRWYFDTVLGVAVPEDLAKYAEKGGFPDEIAFLRAVWREYFFVVGPSGGLAAEVSRGRS